MQTYKIIEVNSEKNDTVLKATTSQDQGAMNTQQMGSRYVGLSLQFDSVRPLYFYDASGKLIGKKGEYCNLIPKAVKGLDAYVAMAKLSVRPDNKRIAIAYENIDLIEIYTSDGVLLKRLHGPDQFLPSFELRNIGGAKKIGWKDDQRTAYKQIVSDENNFYVLYSGKLNKRGSYKKCTEIYKFDWNGTPKERISLDKPVSNFDIEFSKGIIYGLSTSDFEVLKFQPGI